MDGWYKLDENNKPVPIESYAELRGYPQKFKQEQVREFWVSTVFLALDHSFGKDGPPLLWETMVFRRNFSGLYCERYSSYEEAVAGHQKAVEWAKENAKWPGWMDWAQPLIMRVCVWVARMRFKWIVRRWARREK
jgi:hypothetical protein